MNNIIETMLAKYNPIDNKERENAIKEILQEIALAGLSRGGFFQKAAFYGGTCLRIFHGLNRFSEDLDFALIVKEKDFSFSNYFSFIEKEFLSYGIGIDLQIKKEDEKSEIRSAFLKANTFVLMMSFFPESEESKRVISNQRIRIKLEIDTENPDGGTTEFRYKTLPAPYEVQVFDEETLFAGKICAVLCRNYTNRVKGRDYYDYLFYMGKGTKINLLYLENKLKNAGKIDKSEKITIEKVRALLKDKFNVVDFNAAKEDVSNFINDIAALQFWCKDLFISTIDSLKEK